MVWQPGFAAIFIAHIYYTMQTILGAGGAIGIELAKSLTHFTTDIQLVSRNPKKIHDTDLLQSADLTNTEQVEAAIKGSTVCYLIVGFEYRTRVWEQLWPKLIKDVVAACQKHQVKLVFFDNVYALANDEIPHITEKSTINPSSKKGAIRAWVNHYILEQVSTGKLDAIIARAPDFFGPVVEKSLLMNMVYNNFLKGKAAQWFCNADAIHSTGYTPNLAMGTAMLGNSPEAYNQIWNLPVDPAPITGRQWATLFAEEMGAKNKIQVLPAWSLRLIGLFVPILGEMYEMRYQYNQDYFFDSSKFNAQFNFQPTPHLQAVQQTLAAIKRVQP
jgi:nucleoside-diphosphate-sugar epimerase